MTTTTTRPPCPVCNHPVRSIVGVVILMDAPVDIFVHAPCYGRLVDQLGGEHRAEEHIRALALAPSSGPLGCETCGAPPNSDHPEACYP